MKNLAAVGCMVLLLAVVLTSTPAFGQTYSYGGTDTYYAGERDGRLDGANDAGYITGLWGFLFGIVNVGYVAVTSPRDCPPARVLILEGKSTEYKRGYLDGYKKGRQGQRLTYSIGGAVAGYLIIALNAL
jgi:hypothetical protein